MGNNECCGNRPYGGPECCVSEQPMMDNGYTLKVKAREINIQPMNYGFVVRVGCQTFVFETTEKMIRNLDAYLADPENVEKAWLSGTLVL